MDRPYIICHMLVSNNKKISGGFMFSPEAAEMFSEFRSIRRKQNNVISRR